MDDECEFWDLDGCYCVCGPLCECDKPTIVNVGDELHRILADALAAADRQDGDTSK